MSPAARVAHAWVHLVARAPRLVIALGLATAVAAGVYTVRSVRIDTDRDALLSQELDFRRRHAALVQRFPDLEDLLIVVVDAATPERARTVALEIAARAAQRGDVVADVFVPFADPFLEPRGLYFLEMDELGELLERLVAAQPLLGRLAAHPGLPGLAELLSRSEAEAGAQELARRLEPVLEGMARAAEAVARGAPPHFSWRDALGGRPGLDPRRQLVLLRVLFDHAELYPGRAAIDLVRAAEREAGWSEAADVSIRLTGEVALDDEELESVRRGAEWIAMGVLILVSVVLGFGLRSGRLVAATLVTLVVGLAWTAAFATAAVGRLNLISVSFAALYLGLAVDYAVHVGLRVRDALARDARPVEAVAESFADVGGSLLLCSLTTALGFLAFVPTAYAGVGELGLIAGVGMFVSFAATASVLCAWLVSWPPRAAPARANDGATPWAQRLSTTHARSVRRVAAIVALVALLGMLRVRFDSNPLELRDPDSESVATFRELLEDPATPPWGLHAAATGAEEARAMAAALTRLPAVGQALSLESLVPSDQEAKALALEDAALMLGTGLTGGAAALQTTAESRGRGRAQLLGLASAGEAAGWSRLRRALTDLGDADEGLARWEAALFADLGPTLAMLESSLLARPFGLDDLPPRLRRRWVDDDGVQRVMALPAEDLDRPGAMRAFVADVRTVAPEATGAPSMIVETGDAIVGSFRQAFLYALVAVAVTLGVLRRNLLEVGLILLPLLLAGLLTAATLGLVGLPFNFANVIALPLLLGIGVDSSIHVVHRVRSGTLRGVHPLRTSTGRAVLVSALTTCVSFVNLALSPHRGTASLGLVLAIGIVWTLVCTLLVLPACFPRRWLGTSAV